MTVLANGRFADVVTTEAELRAIVALFFLGPGEGDTLRVGVKAIIVREPALRDSMALNERVPELALVITVERAFFHCGKCIVRRKLWEDHRSEDQPPRPNRWLRK